MKIGYVFIKTINNTGDLFYHEDDRDNFYL